MPENATELLRAALRRLRESQHAPAKAEGDEHKTFQFECVKCGAVNSVTAEDDDSYRTDDETSQVDGDGDDENDGDNDDDEFDDSAAGKLAARLLKAAKLNPDKTVSNTSKAAALKQKYSDRKLNTVDRVLINKGIDPFED